MSPPYMEDFETLKVYTDRRQYLATYSKAHLTKFPTHENFCDALIYSLNGSGKEVAEYWTYCLERARKLFRVSLAC